MMILHVVKVIILLQQHYIMLTSKPQCTAIINYETFMRHCMPFDVDCLIVSQLAMHLHSALDFLKTQYICFGLINYFFPRAVVPVAVKSDRSAGGMRRAWTGRQVCDDTYWWCHCAVNQQIKKQKKTIPCHTQPPLYCATLCFCHVSLCASCVKQRRICQKQY